MTMTSISKTVIAVFEDRAHAQQAVNELKRAGFGEDHIGLASADRPEGGGTLAEARVTESAQDREKSYAGTAATAGVATGAGVGALWGIAVLSGALPAIGPAIAGGALAAILSSTAAGGAAGGLTGALIGLGIPKEEAERYDSEFRAGRTIITVQADGRAEEVRAILREYGGCERMGGPSTDRSAR
jgi:hypothetical protein